MQTQDVYNDPSFSDASGGAASGGDLRDPLDQVASKAHATVDRVHRKASAVTDRMTTQGDRMYRQACGWVSAHPVQAVVAALAAGYLFGRLRH
jgi:ElaB/YqjD/DUF883 family membrane-anchored ribosome-binding protein